MGLEKHYEVHGLVEVDHTVYFGRYSYRGERRCCGDLVTWRLNLNEIEELRRTV